MPGWPPQPDPYCKLNNKLVHVHTENWIATNAKLEICEWEGGKTGRKWRMQQNKLPPSRVWEKEKNIFHLSRVTQPVENKTHLRFWWQLEHTTVNLNYLHFLQRHAFQFSCSLLRQHCRLRTRWENRKIVRTVQMFVFKWCFLCGCRRHCWSSVISTFHPHHGIR